MYRVEAKRSNDRWDLEGLFRSKPDAESYVGELSDKLGVLARVRAIGPHLIPPGAPYDASHCREIGTDFAECQQAVGGYIEPLFMADGDCLLVNEDGLSLGLPLNYMATRIAGCNIVGAAVFVPAALVDAVLNGTPVPPALEGT